MVRTKSGVEFHTVPETGKLLKIGNSTVYRLIAAGKIRAIRIGGSLRITDKEINRLQRAECTYP
jgi:excisionase family DNA binding protein